MTSFQSDDISLETWEPNLIVLPIPENKANASIPLELRVFITNNTTTTFPFIEGILTPELRQEGKRLQPEKLIDSQIETHPYKGIGIPPKQSLVRSLRAKLFWQNHSLQLQTTISGEYSKDVYHQGVFQDLQAGTYQLRFTYSSPEGEFLFFDSNTKSISPVEVAQREPLVTPWATLKLVKPVEANKSAVEVDGICFETVVPETIVKVPLTQPDVDVSVQIGMKITNNTSTPYRFVLFDSLIPELSGAEGLIPCLRTGGSAGWLSPIESDCSIAMPGESVTLFPKAHLIRQANRLWQLIVPGRARSCWLFNDLKLGTYQIQLTYRSLTFGDMFEDEWINFYQDAWIGRVYTPFVEFHLVQS